MSQRIILLVLLCLHVTLSFADSVDEDENLLTIGLLQKYGYPHENHTVVTEDGYILNIHRIPRPGARPVFLMHGLMDSSATFILMGPGKGLGYLLYEQGYDVWMGNSRGNTYCREHVKYTTDEQEFWDFSFHELALFDLPITIDYVLQLTNYTNLHYIGHSQGTTSFWILGSERPEYMEKILLMQALAPIAFFEYCKSPIVNFLGATDLTANLVSRLLGPSEFLPSDDFLNMFSDVLCNSSPLGLKLCKNVLFLFAGYSPAQLNETMLPVILSHDPAGASTKQGHGQGDFILWSKRFVGPARRCFQTLLQVAQCGAQISRGLSQIQSFGLHVGHRCT
ncbi:lipase 1-like isoform X2 [Drosophila hydei]|uniref:Lipase 1-like isoform X2 n=1 Tax=Drosophila hydei TaxID=7224 RepID=A0A6J1LYG2_DROHY|nr:lipase 1-like isoform X2 [Drosophila hydei]